MKILIIAGQFYPDLAGSGIATHYIAQNLAARGHAVTVCVDATNEYLNINPNPSFNIEFIPDFKLFMAGKAGFKVSAEALYEVVGRQRPDVIHVYSYMPMLLLSLMPKVKSAQVFFTFWNAPNKGERALGLYQSSALDLQLAREIIAMDGYDRMILGSKCSFESALDLGANSSRTSFAYHGIDMSQFLRDMESHSTDLDDYFAISSDDIVVTLPGRITARKGVFEAVRALAIVRRTHDVKLLLTSTGGKEDEQTIQELTKLAAKLGVRDALVFSDKMLPREVMPALYKRSNVVIAPSYYEGLGFTAIEALVASRPLVATNVPGLDEIGQDDLNCLMIPPKDEKSLAAAILRLLEDSNLAHRLSSEGPRTVRKFDMNLFVDYLEKEYGEASI